MDIAKIAARLEHTGYIFLDKPLITEQSAKLFTRCHDDAPTRFNAAQVGRGAAKQQINSTIATIKPTFGTITIFLSETFPHEVLISRATRRGIAG